MSQNPKDFFRAKREWSFIKDELLGSYLTPYVAKILKTERPLIYVDFFAGKGKFDDGNDGSPLIALKKIRNALDVTKSYNPKVNLFFYDPLFEDQLRNNIEENFIPKPTMHISVGSLRFEDAISQRPSTQGCNLFAYIDPFGIKQLDLEQLFALNTVFESVEVLLNLNTFGFIREACRVYKADISEIDGFEDVDEFVAPEDIKPEQKASWLDGVAGGSYWRDIVESLVEGRVDGFEAEKQFANEFQGRLKNGFTYVANLPLRIRSANRPKYRMFHACNHPDGFMLMYETMSKTKGVWFRQRVGGQDSLFDWSAEEELVDFDELKRDLCSCISGYTEFTPKKEVLAAFLMDKGIVCREGELNGMLSDLEETGKICVERDPSIGKNGTRLTYWSESGGNRIFLKGANND